jgi:hypothetical protein
MSKELWIEAHERAVEEAMEADPSLEWIQAYESDACAKRADELLRDRIANMIDEARDRDKYRVLP